MKKNLLLKLAKKDPDFRKKMIQKLAYNSEEWTSVGKGFGRLFSEAPKFSENEDAYSWYLGGGLDVPDEIWFDVKEVPEIKKTLTTLKSNIDKSLKALNKIK